MPQHKAGKSSCSIISPPGRSRIHLISRSRTKVQQKLPSSILHPRPHCRGKAPPPNKKKIPSKCPSGQFLLISLPPRFSSLTMMAGCAEPHTRGGSRQASCWGREAERPGCCAALAPRLLITPHSNACPLPPRSAFNENAQDWATAPPFSEEGRPIKFDFGSAPGTVPRWTPTAAPHPPPSSVPPP